MKIRHPDQMGVGLEAIRIPLDSAKGFALLIAAAPKRKGRLDEGLQELSGLPHNWRGRLPATEGQHGILIDRQARDRGGQEISVHEVTRYRWAILNEESNRCGLAKVTVSSSLVEQGFFTEESITGALPMGGFQVINFLGIANIRVRIGDREQMIRFEVRSRKLHFETQYRQMVEEIGEFCNQLLLQLGSPTALRFRSDPARRRRMLLEQFLFLRHALGTEKLALAFEMLRQHAHSRLLKEREWIPVGMAAGMDFVTDPLRHGRDWRNGCHPKPAEVRSLRKYDSYDTPPNQFIKFAIGSFRDLCQQVLDDDTIRTSQGTAYREARQMADTLDAMLSQPFFRQVGRLQRLPLENQALQKREGYRDILHAWLMCEAAAQLDWEGREDAYDGSNRNVAVLYEYWIFFVLHRLMDHLPGVERITKPILPAGDALPFWCQSNGGFTINLKRGQQSVSRFRMTGESGEPLRIHLCYDRVFRHSDVLTGGSYSRRFRPDYTLVILPEVVAAEFSESCWREAEAEAERLGRVAYLHFDAKYRVERLTEIFGNDSDDELEEEAASKATNTYKRADLYKMHTYNDAIRRTVGSFVLYPGNDASEPIRKYHEILPGVGAFILRPDPNEGRGEEELRDFLRDALRHQQTRFTQLRRIQYWTHDTVKEEPLAVYTPGRKPEAISLPRSTVVLGFVRSKLEEYFRTNRLFYTRVLYEDGASVELNLASVEGALFLGWKRDRTSLDWVATIASCQFLSKSRLEETLGMTTESNASHYLLFRFNDVQPFQARNLAGLAPLPSYQAKTSTWLEVMNAPKRENA